MSDYTQLETSLKLGGQVVRVDEHSLDRLPFVEHINKLDLEVSDGGVGGGGVSPAGSTPSAADTSTLSTLHIRPFIEYRACASVLKVCKGGVSETPKGGKRGAIAGFSSDARRRLMRVIGSVRRDASLPLFITLTYPEQYPQPSESKRHLKLFWQRLNRLCPAHGSIWKLEPQRRGAPHYHILTWGALPGELALSVATMWFEVAGYGDIRHLHWHLGLLGHGNVPCVQQVNSFKGVWSYASKYLGKTFEVAGWSEKWTGRYWGIINKYNVPFGELVQQEVSLKDAVNVQRYQRRFAKLKRSNRSVTTFCDVDQWIEKLDI